MIDLMIYNDVKEQYNKRKLQNAQTSKNGELKKRQMAQVKRNGAVKKEQKVAKDALKAPQDKDFYERIFMTHILGGNPSM